MSKIDWTGQRHELTEMNASEVVGLDAAIDAQVAVLMPSHVIEAQLSAAKTLAQNVLEGLDLATTIGTPATTTYNGTAGGKGLVIPATGLWSITFRAGLEPAGISAITPTRLGMIIAELHKSAGPAYSTSTPLAGDIEAISSAAEPAGAANDSYPFVARTELRQVLTQGEMVLPLLGHTFNATLNVFVGAKIYFRPTLRLVSLF